MTQNKIDRKFYEDSISSATIGLCQAISLTEKVTIEDAKLIAAKFFDEEIREKLLKVPSFKNFKTSISNIIATLHDSASGETKENLWKLYENINKEKK